METPRLQQDKIVVSFIGAGNMARSLIVGLLTNDSRIEVRVADPSPEQLGSIRQHWPDVVISQDNAAVVAGCDVLVLAVKPQVMSEVVRGIASVCTEHRPLLVSVAAGIQVDALQQWLGEVGKPANLPIVRCMPNTPALVQTGATGLHANASVSSEQRSLAERILRAVGVTAWFNEESMLDVVTATSGSGPAYYFLMMECMQVAAEKMGLSQQDARLLVTQTALGAARLVLESGESPAVLREQVTSKGGTTAAALAVLREQGIEQMFAEAMQAAAERSQQLATEASLGGA